MAPRNKRVRILHSLTLFYSGGEIDDKKRNVRLARPPSEQALLTEPYCCHTIFVQTRPFRTAAPFWG